MMYVRKIEGVRNKDIIDHDKWICMKVFNILQQLFNNLIFDTIDHTLIIIKDSTVLYMHLQFDFSLI